jgi:hypothetical protein
MTSYDFFTLAAVIFLARISSEGMAWIFMFIFTLLSLGNLIFLIIGSQS